ncbi:heat-inducible transcription repressor HrcA [bacterium]|nr:heat-inducible transcription repressor HrcA [bacterium]
MISILSAREQTVLVAVIEHYIATAEPVSSQQLCAAYGFKWSSATVRNVLARLEAGGFLNRPYTSAGKVPTVKAYRYLVERLLGSQPSWNRVQRKKRFEILQEAQETDKIVSLAAKVLAVTSQLLAVTWLLGGSEERLARIQLISLMSQRMLLIVQTTSGEEFHQVFTLEATLGLQLVKKVNHWVNRHGQGKTASELELLARADWSGLDCRLWGLLRQALHWASVNLSAPAQEELAIEGASNLILQPEFNNISAMRQLVAMLDQGDELIRFFSIPGIERSGVRVVIAEAPWKEPLPALSLVTEDVALNGRQTMRIGIIGPQRMAYPKVIALVQDTAEALVRVRL